MKFITLSVLALHAAGTLAAGAKLVGRDETCDVLEKTYGCQDGYCWEACGQHGSNQWCWTAASGGSGDWITCSADSDCNWPELSSKYGETGCGIGDGCDDCGCSC